MHAIKWAQKNLFSGVWNTILTLVSIYLIVLTVPPMFDWLIVSAVWTGDSRAASSSVVVPVAPYPRSTTSGSDASRSTGCRAIHRSTRRNRFVPVVPRVGRPVGAERGEGTPP